MTRVEDVRQEASADLEAIRDSVEESISDIEDHWPRAVVQVLEQLRVLRDGISVLISEYALAAEEVRQ